MLPDRDVAPGLEPFHPGGNELPPECRKVRVAVEPDAGGNGENGENDEETAALQARGCYSNVPEAPPPP